MKEPLDKNFADEVITAFDYEQAPLETVVVYGSGAFHQEGYSAADLPMVDFMFAVDNPELWHEQNIQARPQDYSNRGLVKSTRQRLQRMGGALWYHPYVGFGDREIKYGLIASADLEKDCREWDRLYAAGRLQKPTDIRRSSKGFDQAYEANLIAANIAAVLLAKPTFTEREHFEGIAGISYTGDPRMVLGFENPEKIPNIVAGNPDGFETLHGPILEVLETEGALTRLGVDSHKFERTDDRAQLQALARDLPFKLPHDPAKVPSALRRRIALTVLGTGIMQPLKSKFTTSTEGQKRYLAEKKAKSKR